MKKLTHRLRNGTETPEDLHCLADLLIYYRRVLASAHADIEALCADMTRVTPMSPRVKTLKTTLEKLHRHPELHSLAQIRDLAGLRVVVHGDRAHQDKAIERIKSIFEDRLRPPKIIDRRRDPRAGYRAVHLEVRRDGVLLEVQVRTELQHRWAEAFERAADLLGRGLRYGEPVDLSRAPDVAHAILTRLAAGADVIDQLERGVIDDVFGRELAVVARESIQTALAEIADQLKEWKALT